VDYRLIPDFFIEQPVLLSFWMGMGQEDELSGKVSAIQNLEMRETLRAVTVFSGVDGNYHLFMAVSRPRELTAFPKMMKVFLFPPDKVGVVRKNEIRQNQFF